MTEHDPLHGTMFWTGALIALTPMVIGLVVLGVVWYHRRRRGAEPPHE